VPPARMARELARAQFLGDVAGLEARGKGGSDQGSPHGPLDRMLTATSQKLRGSPEGPWGLLQAPEAAQRPIEAPASSDAARARRLTARRGRRPVGPPRSNAVERDAHRRNEGAPLDRPGARARLDSIC
jgi:hypothetical protein